MKMFCKQVLFLACCLVVYGDYFIPKPKGSDLEIPESLEKLEQTFPQGSDWMRLLKAESTIAKHGTLKLIFRDFPENADEVIIEKSIFIYLSHRENAPTTNYRVQIRDLFTDRLITYKFLPIQTTGWHKVLLNRWPEDRELELTSANHGLEIRLRQNGGEEFDFEEFYKNENSNHKFLPSLLIYYENKGSRSLKDFFNVSEFENLHKLHSNMPANPRRLKRRMPNPTPNPNPNPNFNPNPNANPNPSPSNTSCSYVTKDVYTYFNLSAINPFYYHPNTTVSCTGSCTSPSPSPNSPGTSNTCVPSKKRALIILFWEKSSFVLRSFPDTIVEDCACGSLVGNVTVTGNNG